LFFIIFWGGSFYLGVAFRMIMGAYFSVDALAENMVFSGQKDNTADFSLTRSFSTFPMHTNWEK
jgi:hypothetical protein